MVHEVTAITNTATPAATPATTTTTPTPATSPKTTPETTPQLTNPNMRAKMEQLVREHQKRIVERVEAVDGCKFRIEPWKRADGSGEGVTAVIENGNVIERGGANISIVHGFIPEAGVRKMRENHAALRRHGDAKDLPYWVCGLSLIMHPKNPMAPTVHLNYRYFETQNEDGSPAAWWFGGGADLTPTYLFEEDAIEFHEALKEACDAHGKEFYPEFKPWCDRYFYNSHRSEARGIGGIFFDDLIDEDPDRLFRLCESCLKTFVSTYVPILERRKDMPFTKEQREWQEIRRGRYVEFNLVHDRGTAFGLLTPGSRIESILVSMPRVAQWRYDYHPAEGSEEARLIEVLTKPVDWIAKGEELRRK